MSPNRTKILESLNLAPSRPGTADETVDQRIQVALKAAQRHDYFFDESDLVDPSKLSPWTRNSSSENELYKLFNAVSHQENQMYRSPTGTGTDLPVNPFNDLRQTLMSIAARAIENPDRKVDGIIAQDEASTSAICIRVVSVHELGLRTSPGDQVTFRRGEPTPLALVLYAHDTRARLDSGAEAVAIPWLQRLMRNGGPLAVKANLDEQHLLLQMLLSNTNRLIPNVQVQRWAEEKDFKVSFLMPCQPLNSALLAKYYTPTMCGVCGIEATGKCSGCGTETFCSRKCQVEGWPRHKAVCRDPDSIPHWTFHTDFYNQKYVMNFNKYDCLLDMRHGARLVPDRLPDTGKFGKGRFVVKLQVALASVNDVRIYDSTKTFDTNLHPQEGFGQLLDLIRLKGRDGLRLYIYARRVSDKCIKLYHGDLPEQSAIW